MLLLYKYFGIECKLPLHVGSSLIIKSASSKLVILLESHINTTSQYNVRDGQCTSLFTIVIPLLFHFGHKVIGILYVKSHLRITNLS